MNARLAFVSLAALAWADCALAQPVEVPTDGTGGELVGGPGGGALAFPVVLPPPPVPVATDITPDQGNALDLGTQVSQAGNVYTIDGGTRAGNNLFHSFTRFDLGQGDLARWVHSAGDPLTLRNVINRVTGGDPSHIFGTIDSTALPNADFFFINPAGIVFGEGARVDVPAAAHFSTAQEIRFAGGPAFTIATPNGSTFSVAAPAAFGFVGGQGSIHVADAAPGFLARGGALSLSAANVAVTDSRLAAGSLAIAAFGDGAGEVALGGPARAGAAGQLAIANSRLAAPRGITLSAADLLIDASEAVAITGDHNGGAVDVAAANLLARDSRIGTESAGDGAAGNVRVAAGSIRLERSSIGSAAVAADSRGSSGNVVVTAGSLTLDNSEISAATFARGNAGDLTISSGSIDMRSSLIGTFSRGGAGGGAGFLKVEGDTLAMRDSSISSLTVGSKDAGEVLVDVRDILLADRSEISALSACFSDVCGRGGGVRVIADTLSLSDSAISSRTLFNGDAGDVVIDARAMALESSVIESAAAPGSSGTAGDVDILAGSLRMSAGSRISSDTSGPGDAGFVRILAEGLEVQNSSITSRAGCEGGSCGGELGRAGDITIEAGSVAVSDGAVISTSTMGDKPAGFISIFADRLLVDSFARISSSTSGAGHAGIVHLRADEIVLSRFAEILSDTSGTGDAGIVLVSGHNLSVTGRSVIDSSTLGSGHAGGVAIQLSGNLLLDTGGVIRSEAEAFSTGDAGLILISAKGDVNVTNFAEISSNVRGSGIGGLIAVSADEIFVTAGGKIMSDLDPVVEGEEGGLGGEIKLEARRIFVSGAGAGPGDTFISSDTFGVGDAGSVTVKAREQLVVADGGFISSDTYDRGDAGEVTVSAPDILLSNQGAIQSIAQRGSTGGDAGFVTVSASNRLTVGGGSYIATSTGSSGDAGNLRVDAGNILLDAGSIESAAALGSSGNAGEVEIRVGQLVMRNGSEIISDTMGSGNAGLVRIAAADVAVDGSTISSRARCEGEACSGLGAAGDVTIVATGTVSVTGSINRPAGTITTSSAGVTAASGLPGTISTSTDGDKNAGNVSIEAARIDVAGGGRIASTTTAGGHAGTVRLRGNQVNVTDLAAVATRAAEGSSGDAGLVEIEARDIRISDGSTVTSASAGSGAAGTVRLKGNNVTVELAAVTSSAGINARQAGTVSIEAANVLLDRRGSLLTSTAGAGPAGQVFISADNLRLDRQSSIASNTGGAGAAGGVLIQARSVELAGQSEIESRTEEGSTGNAGAVLIEGERLLLRQGSTISSETVAAGNAGSVTISVRDVAVTDRSTVSSAAHASGNAGTVLIGATNLLLDTEARVSSRSTGTGAAGDVLVVAGDVRMDNGAAIESSAGPRASTAGTVVVVADTLAMANRAAISTSTLGRGPAGQIGIAVDDLSMNSGARIATNTGGPCEHQCVQSGDAGEIAIIATGKVALAGGSEIASNSNAGSGNAGRIEIEAGELRMSGGRISTGTSPASTGASGVISIATGDLTLEGASSIETISRNAKPAGMIDIEAQDVVLRGQLARIASSNENHTAGDAGAVFIAADNITLFDGAQINTSSLAGAAGDISLLLPTNGFLTLDSLGEPSLITTSSGPGTGGRIVISSPFAIISNGGKILALGQQGGANVAITTQYFIRSSDRTNVVAVDGSFLLEAAAYDVSAGTVNRDLSVIDASGVLRGQCAAVRQTGQVSQLVVRPIGPYGTRPTSARPDPTRLLTALELQASCS